MPAKSRFYVINYDLMMHGLEKSHPVDHLTFLQKIILLKLLKLTKSKYISDLPNKRTLYNDRLKYI